jgi:hypothetical protein
MRPLVICVLSLLIGSGCFAQAENSLPISQKKFDETLQSYAALIACVVKLAVALGALTSALPASPRRSPVCAVWN